MEIENKKKEFKPFYLTEEISQQIINTKEIPVHFYNQEGQIIIYKKKNATDKEIERLFRYTQQGKLFYDLEDRDKLGIREDKQRDIPEGFTDTKLITEQQAKSVTEVTRDLFSSLRKTAVISVHARKTSEKLSGFFKTYEQNPDILTGLINILDFFTKGDSSYEVELATKRVVVAMAMKTRGISAQTYKQEGSYYKRINYLMMSALLCDIGYNKMNLPTGNKLNYTEMNYIRNHPLLSYLLIAHEKSITIEVKRNILFHHRPMRNDANTNNYPSRNFLLKKLTDIKVQFEPDRKREEMVKEIDQLISMIKQDIPYDEDAGILCLASEFASLTSKVPWREPFSAQRAVQMIVNNSFFTYPERLIHEFLDYTAISLCDNKKVIREGDFIILLNISQSGKYYFEAAQITNTNRYQSRPGVDRLGTLMPVISREPKIHFSSFNLESLQIDRRFAHFELLQDPSRRIVYVINPDYDEQLYEAFYNIIKGKYSKKVVL